jgi:hypothetical protein
VLLRPPTPADGDQGAGNGLGRRWRSVGHARRGDVARRFLLCVKPFKLQLVLAYRNCSQQLVGFKTQAPVRNADAGICAMPYYATLQSQAPHWTT